MAKEKIYLFDHSPHLRGEWDYDKNTIDPTQCKSHTKAHWKCSLDHTWESTISKRKSGGGCPYCKNKAVWPGFNDLGTTHPHLASEFVGDPTTIIAGTKKKLSWRCRLGHSWQAAGYSRTSKRPSGCPYCSGFLAIEGETDLLTNFPEIASEILDREINPATISCGSNVKLEFRCSRGHIWVAIVKSRTNGTGCPYCAGNSVVIGETDLRTTHPSIADELANAEEALKVSKGSDKILEFVCKLGHRYRMSVYNRCSSTGGCPFCSGRKILVGFNSLADLDPKLACELVDENVTAAELTRWSNRRVKWRCENSHEWFSTVGNRSKGKGCLACTKSHTSKVESRLRELVSLHFNEVHPDHTARVPVTGYSFISASVDILFDGVCLEYDGEYWHTSREEPDTRKTVCLLQSGYKVVRIREGGLPSLDISNQNLLQISVRNAPTDDDLGTAVDKIKQWLRK